jgi:PUA domain protein
MSPDTITIRQRHLMKSKDIREFIQTLKGIYSEELVDQLLTTKSKVEWIKIDNDEELYAIENILSLWKKDGKYIPLLSYLFNHTVPFKAVKVDKGAIPYVSNGADVMRPGITFIEPSIKVDDVVLIQDSVHGKTLAVGLALFSGEEMQKMAKGKVIHTIHSVNDPIWAFSKSFK